jgi:hypothetical protein
MYSQDTPGRHQRDELQKLLKPGSACGSLSDSPLTSTPPPERDFLTMPPEEDIESFNAAEAARFLAIATAATYSHQLRSWKHIELCCKRIRVLCCEPATQRECCEAQAGAALANTMHRCLPYLPSALAVQWHALAALVNLCLGETNEYRDHALSSGALRAIVAVMKRLSDYPGYIEVHEMACVALQNACYGEDANALARRRAADDEGAIEAVLAVMRRYKTVRAASHMQSLGQATLQLLVHELPELRIKARQLGAKAEWVTEFGGGDPEKQQQHQQHQLMMAMERSLSPHVIRVPL